MHIFSRLVVACALALALSVPRAQAQPQPARLAPELLRPRLVAIDGPRRLNVRCAGAGSPTVVFEQGGEGMMFNWAKVQPAVQALTRTCVYDRGGFGWSDPPRYPVTARSVTDDLDALIRRAGIEGPVVLVGHSIGGFYATVYADRFPGRAAGLVLVDPGFSGQDLAPSVVEAANNRRGEGNLVRCAELARTGKLTAANLAANRCYPVPAEATGPEEQRYALNAVTRPHWYEAEHSQSVNYFTGDGELSVSHRQARDTERPWGDLPVIVLTRDRMEGDPWRTPQQGRAFFEQWRAGHAALSARAARGRHVVVENSGHFIQNDRPDAVIAAIREVIQAVRSR